jgi:uroporphyrinogen-III synthase
LADLQQRVVAFLESRRTEELASLIARHRGVPLAAPCLREVHDPDAPALVAAIERLCADGTDIAVFLTGVGTATLFEAARRRGREADLLAVLRAARVAARGPKPTAVLRHAGVRIDLLAPPPHTTVSLLEAMAVWDVAGARVTVQLYGGEPTDFLAGLRARGAVVATVAPYVWARPLDETPVLRLIDALRDGRVAALIGTSATQVDHLFAIAADHRRAVALREGLAGVVVAAQGPVCAAAFARHGVPVALTPPTGHMGALVLALADHLAARPPVSLAAIGAPAGETVQ